MMILEDGSHILREFRMVILAHFITCFIMYEVKAFQQTYLYF